MDLDVSGEIFEWRGPAPYLFVRVPEDQSEQIGEVARAVTYGWGMVPVHVRCGTTEWTTSLWPKDGGYVVPIKVAAQRGAGIGEGDRVDLRVSVRFPAG